MAEFTNKPEDMSFMNCLSQKRSPRSESPSSSLKTEDKPEVEEPFTRQTLDGVKTKKSFCIDALLARNENKNLTEFNLRDIRCNNELARLFRQKTDQKKTCDEKAVKFFAPKSQLFKTVESESAFESAPKIMDSFDEAEDTSENKMDQYRDYENSGSITPFSNKSNDTRSNRSNSPNQSELSSPPISPGNENDYETGKNIPNGDELRGSHIFPRPGLLVTNGPQAFINQNPNLMLGSRPNLPHLNPHPAFLSYSSPHSFSSAFHPLNPGSPGNSKIPPGSNPNLKQGVNMSPNSGGAILGLNATGTQHLHHMQLEWLARTGMFYPRLPELAGTFEEGYCTSVGVYLKDFP